MRFSPFSVSICALSVLVIPCRAQDAPAQRETYRKFALEHPGDAVNGATIFRQREKLACTNCHEITGTEKSGPNLDGIADKFPRPELIKHVLEPSAYLKPGYEQVTVVTGQGQVVTGRIRVVSKLEYKLIDANGKSISIKQDDIEEVKPSLISMMPENLTATISPSEFADLISYLETLHSAVLNGYAGPNQPVDVPILKTSIEFRPIHPPEMKFANPVWFVPIPGQPRQSLVLEQQEGLVWRLDRSADPPKKELFLDLHDQIAISSNQGLMCLAFHPRFQENGRYFVKHEIQERGRVVTTVVERIANPDKLRDSGKSSRRILELQQPAHNNTGGCLMFGQDGMLYIAFGDGGPSYDKPGHGQNLATLQGSILRIDVDHQADGLQYAIPADNPFIQMQRKDPTVRAETWAYGFREPWRFSFDRLTGDLWVGDVGQDKFEEVAIARRGENHGWNVLEGFQGFSEEFRRQGEIYTEPLFAYPHSFGIAVVGGYVYRGDPKSSFFGAYIFGDYESRRIWGLRQKDGHVTAIREIGRAPEHIASFGEDENGEIYFLGYEGSAFHLDLSNTQFE